MAISKVGIIGCGAMGVGMAEAIATAGVKVVCVKMTPGPVIKVQEKLASTLGKSVERGKMDAALRDQILGNITFTNDLVDVIGSELIIESIIEDLDAKIALFQKLEEILPPTVPLTSNTSTLSVTAMMAACKHRNRFAGLHFFNPAPTMKLVEVIHGFETSDAVIETLKAFCVQIKKEAVLVQDTTGFVVNRLLTPYLLNAIRLLETGTSTIDGIDKAMMLGAAHPMGPFALADYIGLDIVKAMAENCYADARSSDLATPHTLTRLVQLGYLGRKSGRGFYDYSQKPPVPNGDLKRPVA